MLLVSMKLEILPGTPCDPMQSPARSNERRPIHALERFIATGSNGLHNPNPGRATDLLDASPQ
ncbi:hypothetical protein [Dokdonella sp.]|uniref:hypothetical protein n=1 Tax=Dokdonella sp. TaxID=2291710 RepID=UPI003C537F79